MRGVLVVPMFFLAGSMISCAMREYNGSRCGKAAAGTTCRHGRLPPPDSAEVQRPHPAHSEDSSFGSADANREFVLETIRELNSMRLHVLSVESAKSSRTIAFERGKLMIALQSSGKHKQERAKKDRNYVLRTIKEFNGHGMVVISFTYGKHQSLAYKRGNLTIPLAGGE